MTAQTDDLNPNDPPLLGSWSAACGAAGLAVAALFLAALWAQSPPPGSVATYWTTYDIPSYYANAREVFEGGNGLLYANPYAFDAQAPRIYSHLQLLAMGWLWRLGVGFEAQEALWRLLAAPVMFAALGLLVRRWVGEVRLAAATFALAAFGAGTAGLLAAAAWAGGFSDGGLAATHAAIEGTTSYWALNIARNLLYSTEVFYHALFFATALAFLRGAPVVGLALFAITWWAHPFTGVKLGAILAGWLAIECLLDWRQARSLRASGARLAGVLAIQFAFLGYYFVFLNSFALHRGLMDVWKGEAVLANATAPLWHLLVSCGPLLLGLGWFATGEGRRALREDPAHRLLAVWGAAILLLMHHDKWLVFATPVQPLHFARGYEYVALAVWFALWVRAMLADARPAFVAAAMGATLLVAVSDNALFFARYFAWGEGHRVGILSIPARQHAAMQWLDSVQPTRSLFILEQDPSAGLGYLANTGTHHRTFVGHSGNTPNREARVAEWMAWYAQPTRDFFDRIGADMILVDRPFFAGYPGATGDRVEWLGALLGPGWKPLPVPEDLQSDWAAFVRAGS